MLVTPGPVRLSILFSQARKVDIPAMVLFYPYAISAILVVVPLVIVIVLFVVIRPVLLRSQRGRYGDGYDKRGSQQGRTQETGRVYSHIAGSRNYRAKFGRVAVKVTLTI